MQLVKINDWHSFRKVFSEEGFSYEFRLHLNGGLKSSKILACVASSDYPKQEIYEIENLIDDSTETITLECLMTDNSHIINKALIRGALLYEKWD